MNGVTELYVILADYSNDLNNLKKRNGKLPAEAAIERFLNWVEQALPEEYDGGVTFKKPDEKQILEDGRTIGRNEAIKEIRQTLAKKKEKL